METWIKVFVLNERLFILALFPLQVAIVGVIRDAQESATNIMYTINDMTGEDIIVRKWLDNEVGFVVLHLLIELTCAVHISFVPSQFYYEHFHVFFFLTKC